MRLQCRTQLSDFHFTYYCVPGHQSHTISVPHHTANNVWIVCPHFHFMRESGRLETSMRSHSYPWPPLPLPPPTCIHSANLYPALTLCQALFRCWGLNRTDKTPAFLELTFISLGVPGCINSVLVSRCLMRRGHVDWTEGKPSFLHRVPPMR